MGSVFESIREYLFNDFNVNLQRDEIRLPPVRVDGDRYVGGGRDDGLRATDPFEVSDANTMLKHLRAV